MSRVSNYVNKKELLSSIFECIFQFFGVANGGGLVCEFRDWGMVIFWGEWGFVQEKNNLNKL
jgi:hypothetical protein